jgi:hypothetical protein
MVVVPEFGPAENPSFSTESAKSSRSQATFLAQKLTVAASKNHLRTLVHCEKVFKT